MPISHETEQAILNHLQNGDSYHATAAAVGVRHDTACNVAKCFGLTFNNGKKGRPQKLSDTTKHFIVRQITSGQIDTATKATKVLQESLGITVSPQTVRNALKEKGMHAKHKVKKPAISTNNHKKRLEFARRHQNWTVEDWKRIVWSDETKINRLGSDGHLWCWAKPGEGLNSHTITPTVKHGGGSLMVWGCFTAEGVGYLCKIDGGLDSDLYCSILKEDLMGSLKYYNLDVNDVIFQQDNDPKHMSKRAQKCLNELGLTVLEWPPQSPDLNPIEHLWDVLKRKLNAHPEQPKSMHELWERIESDWESITKDECMHLIESMPERIEAVLKAKGGVTKY
jgi:transposase